MSGEINDLAERNAAVVRAADVAHYARLLTRFHDSVLEIAATVEDEGDRIYFGSTNDVDTLKDLARELEDARWDRVLRVDREMPDLYGKIDKQLAQLVALEAERDEARNDHTVLQRALVGETGASALLTAQKLRAARHVSEWHEEDGDVLWWTNPITEAPYVGSPLDMGRNIVVTVDGQDFVATVGGWPGYHEWWTPILLRPTTFVQPAEDDHG